MAIKNVQDLLLQELRDLYDAEKQLVRALPKMAKGASSEQLRQAFEEHLDETKGQVERLEQVFETLDKRSRGKRLRSDARARPGSQRDDGRDQDPAGPGCRPDRGRSEGGALRDAAYGSVRALAEACGHQEAAQLLEETLEEEKAADAKLNQIALSEVNRTALEAAA